MSDGRKSARRAWWTFEQATAWIIHRTESAVGRDDAFDNSPAGENSPEISAAAYATLKEAIERPYPREGRFVVDPVNAVQELEAAIARDEITVSVSGTLKSSDVRRLWPGTGRGNAQKRHLEQDHVVSVARAMRSTPKLETSPRRLELLQKLRIGVGSDERELEVQRIFREARKVAHGSIRLVTCSCPSVARDGCLAAGKCIPQEEADRQFSNVESWFRVGRPRKARPSAN